MRSSVSALVSVACLLVLTHPSPAQTSQKSAPPPAKLDKAAVAAKLAGFRKGVAARMATHRRGRSGQQRVSKWLKSFQVVQSKHYLIYTNGPRNTSRKFGKSLEKLYSFIQRRFAFDDLGHHLECYIFKTMNEYHRFCVEIAGLPIQAAKASSGHAMAHYYATYYQSPTAGTVMHEASHQIMMACLKVMGIGSWFQEGFAVYIEKAIRKAKTSSGMRADLRRGKFYSLTRMVEFRTLTQDSEAARNYRHAGSIIEFLIESTLEPIRGRFATLLRAARRGYGGGRAVTERLFQAVYGLSIAEVGALWKKHCRVAGAVPGEKSSKRRKQTA